MNRLRFWRQERGLSQIELSRATGIPRYRLQLAENGLGNLQPEEIEVIAKTLGVNSSDFFSFKTTNKN
jgi:transcriptional regulator with XRE-family HTH domain